MKLLKTGLAITTKGDGTKLYKPFGVFEEYKIFGLFPRTRTYYIRRDYVTSKQALYYFDSETVALAFMDKDESVALEALDMAVKYYLHIDKRDKDRAVVKEEIKILKQY